MDCKKCGAPLIEGALYCSKCGTRQDDKIACKYCGKDIPNDSVFCSFCGKRVDGKEICLNCGVAFEGDFCHACGNAKKSKNKESENVESYPQKPANTGLSDKTKSVLNVVKQSLLYSAICVTFICCFLVSLVSYYKVDGERIKETVGSTSFYFLIESFIDVGEHLKEVDVFVEYENGMWLNAGLMAGTVAVIMLTSIVSFIIASVKFFSAVSSKKTVSLGKLASITAIINLSALIFLRSILLADSADTTVKLSFGAVPVIEIVFVAILLVGAMVIHFILNGVKKDKILQYVLGLSLILLSYVMMETVSTRAVAVGEGDLTAKFSACALLIGLFTAYGQTPSNMLEAYGNSLEISLIMFVVYLALYLLIVVFACIKTVELIGERESSMAQTFISSVCLLGAVAYFVIAIIFSCEKISSGICASPICALIFAIAIFVISLISALNRRAPKQELKEEVE
ncbi:MAG: zinc ribbon domain-containing protein [Clostridia bacterium]|nr:zinc ribbon domain-containing protein [Clostridia bacterium]